MKITMNLEEHNSIKEKRNKSIKTKEQSKSKFNEHDDMSILLEKKIKKSGTKSKSSHFRNNYKNYQYDYEEDFYEPRY